MSFCSNCGRPRDETARFCGTCGTEYEDSPATQDTQSAGDPADTVHEGLTADATRIDRAADEPDPFASWYQPAGAVPDTVAGAAGYDTSGYWQPTQPVRPASAPAPGYPPPPAATAVPGAPFPPYSPAPPGTPRRGSRRGLFIAGAIVVVLAAGGGAYALATTLGRPAPARAPASPGTSAAAPAPPATTAPGTPGGGPSATASPSPTLSLVAVAPGVASSATASVETLLSHYFRGINNHDYTEYQTTLDPAERARQSASAFAAGYATTTDLGMTLTSLASESNGRLTATVTFTSHQAAAQSVDKSTCNNWTLNLYLVRQGSGYLIGKAPAGYRPAHADC